MSYDREACLKDKWSGYFNLDPVTYGRSTDFGTGLSGLYSKATNLKFDLFEVHDVNAWPSCSRVNGASHAEWPPVQVYKSSRRCLPSSASPGYDSH